MRRRAARLFVVALALRACEAPGTSQAATGASAPPPPVSRPSTPPPSPAPLASASPAAGVTLQMTADRTSVTVGDPITLTVRLTYPSGISIRSFSPAASLGSLALLERIPGLPRPTHDGRMEEVSVLRVAAYQVGPIEVPALQAVFVDSAGKEGKVESAALQLQIASVLKPGETAPADIKPQAIMPERAIWPWVALGLAALAAAIGIAWRRLRRRGASITPPVPAAPPRPAHEIAYAELERLLSSGLLESGRLKELYIELAEILRRYLGARFEVDTFEKTTTEILESLRMAKVPAKALSMAAQFFAACDLVKFAKYLPGLDETRQTVQKAYALIDETRSAPAVAAESVAASPAAGVAG